MTVKRLRETVRGMVAPAWRLGRRIVHSWIHPFRRLQATAKLARRGWPRDVLFVCYGNICRSPYAAVAFARALPASRRGEVRVHSAGFIGPGRSSPSKAQSVARARGVDLSSHVSSLLKEELSPETDLVVVMTGYQQRALQRGFGVRRERVLVLGDLDTQITDQRAIPDPYGKSEEEFEKAYAQIDRCLDDLVRVLNDGRAHGT